MFLADCAVERAMVGGGRGPGEERSEARMADFWAAQERDCSRVEDDFEVLLSLLEEDVVALLLVLLELELELVELRWLPGGDMGGEDRGARDGEFGGEFDGRETDFKLPSAERECAARRSSVRRGEAAPCWERVRSRSRSMDVVFERLGLEVIDPGTVARSLASSRGLVRRGLFPDMVDFGDERMRGLVWKLDVLRSRRILARRLARLLVRPPRSPELAPEGPSRGRAPRRLVELPILLPPPMPLPMPLPMPVASRRGWVCRLAELPPPPLFKPLVGRLGELSLPFPFLRLDLGEGP